MATPTYLIALGSNRRGRHGAPAAEIRAALTAIGVTAASPITSSEPLGPSLRRYANAAALVETVEGPRDLLTRLQGIERAFGRRRGRRWGARVIDLDIILWSGGPYSDAALIVPHPAFRTRGFVLHLAAGLAPGWRDPMTGLSLRQLSARLTRAARLPSRDADGRGP